MRSRVRIPPRYTMSNLCHIRLLWESCFVKKWITLLCTLFFTIEFVRKEGHIKMRFTCPGSFSRIRRTLGAALTSSGALLWQTLSCCWKRKRLLLDFLALFVAFFPQHTASKWTFTQKKMNSNLEHSPKNYMPSGSQNRFQINPWRSSEREITILSLNLFSESSIFQLKRLNTKTFLMNLIWLLFYSW